MKGKILDLKKGEVDKDVAKKLDGWLEEGEYVAVYRNVDMGSFEVGRLAFIKVGKNSTLKKAPNRMPDNSIIPIAWRYYLEGVIKSKKELNDLLVDGGE